MANDAQTIYRRYTKDFVFPGGKSSQGGLRKGQSIFFSGKYDEPTYLTFRLEFDFDCYEDYAIATMDNGFSNAQYNEMPHPFFNIIFDDVHGGKENTNTKDRRLKQRLNNNPHIFNDVENDKNALGNVYSAYNYLKYSLGEHRRASMLLQLKTALYDLQESYPFYIKSIDGISDLMKVEPTKGIRIPEDRNTITLTCEEGVDLKLTQILQLYRKIVWDDVYQRWVLPDMMRFFKMKIYISEMRLFHDTQLSSVGSGPATPDIQINAQQIPEQNKDNFTLVSNSINEMLPTICIECTQCMFDLEDNMSHIGTLSANIHDTQSPNPVIKIHVGNIMETHSYKLNADTDMSDQSGNITPNGIGELYYRYSDNDLYMDPTYDPNGEVDSIDESITSTFNRLGYDASDDSYNKEGKDISMSMFENEIDNQLDMLAPMDQSSLINGGSLGSIQSTAVNYYKKGIISTLIDNSLGYVSGTINTAIAQGRDMLMAIPIGNGYTIGDVWSSITTGDVGYLFNMIRDAIEGNDAVYEYEQTHGPGTASGPMVRIVLQNIVDSAATSGVTPFVQTAMQIVNNPSVATDATNKIADIYNAYQKLLTNEVIDDTDNGYQNPGLVQPGYMSSATSIPPVDNTNQANKGLSNEVIDDTDNGYQNPGLVNPGYVSTATVTPVVDKTNPANKGLSNEVIDDLDHGYKNPGLVQPGYVSTANNIPVVDKTNPANKGLSNEVIDDLDNGYQNPGLVQPGYKSSANTIPVIDKTNPANRGLSNEVIDDLDHGYKNPGLVQPGYVSTATSGRKINWRGIQITTS